MVGLYCEVPAQVKSRALHLSCILLAELYFHVMVVFVVSYFGYLGDVKLGANVLNKHFII